jgi:hypothetical protein
MGQMRQAESGAERADSPYFNGRSDLLAKPQFRLEYARDFAPPRFVSGGLREGPIGGGAMGGGMGGMGGGMRSVKPRGD